MTVRGELRSASPPTRDDVDDCEKCLSLGKGVLQAPPRRRMRILRFLQGCESELAGGVQCSARNAGIREAEGAR
jgi:hypothetical protein